MSNSINFRAKLLHPVEIQKYDHKTKEYSPSEASFIEIDPNCKSDRNAMRRLTNEWCYAQYAQDIYNDVLEMSSEESRINSKFYAVTTQNKSLNSLDSSKILGITELSLDRKEPYVEFLQVAPELTKMLNIEPKIKHVGTSILNSLKKMYESLTLYTSVSAFDFYQKNDFLPVDSKFCFKLRWKK